MITPSIDRRREAQKEAAVDDLAGKDKAESLSVRPQRVWLSGRATD